jgi:hypothetical protein
MRMAASINSSFDFSNTDSLSDDDFSVSSPSSLRRRRYSTSVSPEVDKALIQFILTPSGKLFWQLCRGREVLFGKPGSKERRKVRDRRLYLVKLQQESPDSFLEICCECGAIDNNKKSVKQPPKQALKKPLPRPVLPPSPLKRRKKPLPVLTTMAAFSSSHSMASM